MSKPKNYPEKDTIKAAREKEKSQREEREIEPPLDVLQAIVDLIAADKFEPNILIGMINGIAKSALSNTRPDRQCK